MASAAMVSPFQEESAEPSAEDVEMRPEPKEEPIEEVTKIPEPEAEPPAAETEEIKPNPQWTHEELHRLFTLKDLARNWAFLAFQMTREFGSAHPPGFFDLEACQRKYDRIIGVADGREPDKEMIVFLKGFLRKTSSERHAEGNAAKLSRVRRYFELAQYAMQDRLTETQIIELLGANEYNAFVSQSILEREGEKESWMLADLFCSKLTEEDWNKARKPEDLINKLNTLPVNRNKLRFKHPTPSTEDEDDDENASVGSDMDYELPSFNQSFTSVTSTERPARMRKLRPISPDTFTTPTTQPTKRRRSSPKPFSTPSSTPRTKSKTVTWETDDPAAVIIDGTSENVTLPVTIAQTPVIKRGRGRPRKNKPEPINEVIRVEDILGPSTSQGSITPSSQRRETPDVEIISGAVSKPSAIRNVRVQTQGVDARKIQEDDEVICLDSDSEMDVSEPPQPEPEAIKTPRRRGRPSFADKRADTERAVKEQRIKIIASNDAVLQRFPAVVKAATMNDPDYKIDHDESMSKPEESKPTPPKVMFRSRLRSQNTDQPTAVAAAPQNPTSTKSALLSVHAMVVQHPKSPAFRDEVKKTLAPGYSDVIKRQMNLTLIKRLIDEEKISSLTELSEHYILMCMNAIMFNEEIHPVYAEAQELMQFCIRAVQSVSNGMKQTGGLRVNTRRSNKFVTPLSMGTAQRVKEPQIKKEEPDVEVIEEEPSRRSRGDRANNNNNTTTPKTQRRLFTREPSEKRIRRAK